MLEGLLVRQAGPLQMSAGSEGREDAPAICIRADQSQRCTSAGPRSHWSAALSDVAVPAAGATTVKPAATNSTRPNSTLSGGGSTKKVGIYFGASSSMIQRALYVLIGITIIGVLYFLIRAVRLKKPVQKKKYGLLSNYDDSVEMEAVDSDGDDTLYEARSLRR